MSRLKEERMLRRRIICVAALTVDGATYKVTRERLLSHTNFTRIHATTAPVFLDPRILQRIEGQDDTWIPKTCKVVELSGETRVELHDIRSLFHEGCLDLSNGTAFRDVDALST